MGGVICENPTKKEKHGAGQVKEINGDEQKGAELVLTQ